MLLPRTIGHDYIVLNEWIIARLWLAENDSFFHVTRVQIRNTDVLTFWDAFFMYIINK